MSWAQSDERSADGLYFLGVKGSKHKDIEHTVDSFGEQLYLCYT